MGTVELGSGKDVLGDDSKCEEHQKLLASALSIETNESAVTASAIIAAIRHLQITKHPSTRASIVVPTMVTNSPFPRPSLSALYILKDPKTATSFFRGKILDPQWIDPSLPSLWETTCTRYHGGVCNAPPTRGLLSIQPKWLLDVQSQCLIQTPSNCSYVALSYVWGAQNTFQTLSSNINQLQKPGILSFPDWKDQIPITIRDGMTVVKLLGQRYFWVDSLCIVQDNELEKHKEIENMAAIYANAAITILAAGGEHANSGLRGFRGFSQPRNLQQKVYNFAYVRVTQYPIAGQNLELRSDNTLWQRRGWTFQEHLFSRRKLVFDGNSVRWECAVGTWREYVDSFPDIMPSMTDFSFNQLMSENTYPRFDHFTAIVNQFNIREFTYPEDALNAFSGLSYAIGASIGNGLISGLPAAIFDVALLWQPRKKVIRRIARNLNVRQFLPSWSWVGWSGHIEMETASASDFFRNGPKGVGVRSASRVTRLVYWKYHETPSSTGTPINASILSYRELHLKGWNDCARGWTRHPISESPEAVYMSPDPRILSSHFYKHPLYPDDEFWYQIPLREPIGTSVVQAAYISCRTRRARLCVAERYPSRLERRLMFSLQDKRGHWAGVLATHECFDDASETVNETIGYIELVEVAKGYCRDSTTTYDGQEEIFCEQRPRNGPWYEYYWVMWVGWTNRVAYRRGIGRVYKRVWERQEREWIDLMLG
ncbi:heterokaryon incompatibility protein-domain-containing protein [Xylariales sp. PMI_506]|nr:heterokaryon incompatibility protein-domain-containing protein [Xylariales sp. PMI_506]